MEASNQMKGDRLGKGRITQTGRQKLGQTGKTKGGHM